MVSQESRKESLDQVAITKAAAWAWYERGSWFEHNSIRESDCKRRHDYTPKPSRYKLEAMKKQQKEARESPSCNKRSSVGIDQHANKSLLDVYEIKRISKELDCYIESSKVVHHRRSIDGSDHDGRRNVLKERKSKPKSKQKKNGFWMRHGVVCGNRDDVVEHVSSLASRRQRKEDAPMRGATYTRRAIHQR